MSMQNGAKAFIDRAVKHLNPPAGASILEVGCGEGEYSRALAAAGYDVTGIDASAENISTALESEQEQLHFYTHDIRLPFHINYFDYAFNLFGNFGFYRTAREYSNAFRSIANALKHEGIFLFDYINANTAQETDRQSRLSPGDINNMFAFHYLQVQEVFGDYELNGFDIKKSPRLIMIAKKSSGVEFRV